VKLLRLSAALLAASLAGSGCILGVLDYDGKSCDSAVDCPNPYSCLRRADGERACYLADPPGGDGGVEIVLVTPDYCHDAKPVLDQFCLSSCHNPNHAGSGRTDFRLDYYELAGGVPGAKAKASTIRGRVYVSRDMPPVTSPQPSDAQRKLLADWAQGGAVECRPDAGP
jgi:hypothetical protein